MNICILTETYLPEVGGGETQARLLAQGLAALGHAVQIVTRRSNPATARFERLGAITVMRLPPAGPGQFKKWGLSLSSLVWLVTQRRHYDVIFVSGYRIVGIAAVVVAKLLGKVCLLKADSQGEMSGDFFAAGLRRVGRSPQWFVFRLFLWLRNRLLVRANGFVAITDAIANEFAAQGVPASQIHRLPNCVDTARFAPVDAAHKARLRATLGLAARGPIVVYAGRLVSYKGLPLLLEVWRAVHARQPEARLLLVGTGGLDIHNCEAELRQSVQAHNLAASVTFTGSVPNVDEYLQAADVFVLPTENDAFPSALVEAMACGLPAISTHVGAIPSILDNEKTGLLIEPANPHQLGQALHRLLADPGLAARLGQAARTTVQDRYSVESLTRAYAALFQSLRPASRGAGSLAQRRRNESYE